MHRTEDMCLRLMIRTETIPVRSLGLLRQPAAHSENISVRALTRAGGVSVKPFRVPRSGSDFCRKYIGKNNEGRVVNRQPGFRSGDTYRKISFRQFCFSSDLSC
jgi:hypothetical protein